MWDLSGITQNMGLETRWVHLFHWPCPEGLEFLCTNPSYFYRGAGVWVGFGVNVSARAEAVVVKWARYTPSETFL